MSKNEFFKEDIELARQLSDHFGSFAEAAREYCNEKGVPYTDSHRRTLSKLISKLDKKESKAALPKGAVITGGWIRNEKESLRFSVPEDRVDFERARKDLIKDLKNFSPTLDRPKVLKKQDCLLEICMPDFHIGQQTMDKEKELFEKVLWSITDRATANYDIAQIELPIGNDFLNSDNIKYGTTKGTQQFDYSKWHESFRHAWQLLAANITELRNVAPVNVRTILGNHDKTRMFYVGDVLQAYFTNSDIGIFNEVNQFHHFQYGKNLVMYDHGEIKSADYPLIMATELPVEFAATTFREVHTGHIHKEKVDEFRGIKVRFLPSLAKGSDWEKQRGYKHIRQAQGLVWHKEYGLIDVIQHNIL
jgi:hypothetical protein